MPAATVPDELSPTSSDVGLVVLIEHLFLSERENTCKSQKRPYLFGLDDARFTMVTFRPDCMQWSCPHCAQILAKNWIMRTMLMLSESDDPTGFDFVTLTLHEKLKTQRSTKAVFDDAWKKLYQRLKIAQRDFSYVIVPELHKDGRMHVHIVTNMHAPETYCIHRKRKANKQVKRMRHPDLMDKFWKDVPRVCGFGYANDQEHIEGDVLKVAGYIAKYLAKQRKVNQWPSNFKHVRASHDVPDIPEQPSNLDGFNWQVLTSETQLIEKISACRANGYRLLDTHTGQIVL